ncbi:MAG: hypothetical protein R3F14_32210 [Polyangiaceae bacterium]
MASTTAAGIHETYCNADRGPSASRVVLGSLLVADSIRHWKEAQVFYANTGVLTVLPPLPPPSPATTSRSGTLLHMGESIVFALATTCYFLYLIGYPDAPVLGPLPPLRDEHG